MKRIRLAMMAWALSWCGLSAGAEPECACRPPAKTLFNWAVAGDVEEPAEEEEDVIITDRPDFTESPTTVGRGRIQLEAGYTYTKGDGGLGSHSYPLALLRIGMFAEWFELRIDQNFASESQPFSNVDGNEDLGLGFKIALTEQQGCWPQTGLIVETSIPTGHRDFTDDELLPACTYLYAWEVIPDRLNLGGETQFARSRDDADHFYLQMAQSCTVGLPITEKLGWYTEWFCFIPDGAVAADIGPEHYLNGGFTYLITNNFQVDIEAGVGLNQQSDDYFVGSGFAVRW